MPDRRSPLNFRAPFRASIALLAFAVALDAAAAVHALVAPSTERPAPKAAAPAAPIDALFDCYAANSAWGLTYSGKVVDRAGQIRSYRARGKALPVATDVAGQRYVGATELSAKFADSVASGSVDGNTLAEHVAQIDKAAAGTLSGSDTGVRDAGTSTCHAYLPDSGGQRYRDVELGSDGGVADHRVVNDAAEAKALLDWLRSIGVAR
jgi:hypothetical protein